MSVVARPAVADQYKPWTIAQIARTKESCVQVVYKCRFSVLGDLAEIAHLAILKRQPNAIPTTEGLTSIGVSIGVSERVTPAGGCHSVVMNPYVPNYCDGVHPGASSGSGRIVTTSHLGIYAYIGRNSRTYSAQERRSQRNAGQLATTTVFSCGARVRVCACVCACQTWKISNIRYRYLTVAVPRGALGRVEAGICARRASDGSCSI